MNRKKSKEIKGSSRACVCNVSQSKPTVTQGVIHAVPRACEATLQTRPIGYPGPVTQGGTHPVSHPPNAPHQTASGDAPCPASQKRPSAPRSPGRYIALRGRTYYLRKRLPKRISKKCTRTFWRVSLQTPLLSEAMSRAATLFIGLEQIERDIMKTIQTTGLVAVWCRSFDSIFCKKGDGLCDINP